MTEAEWLACDEPTPLLDFLLLDISERRLLLFEWFSSSTDRWRTGKKVSERKLRLFAVARARGVWEALQGDERLRQAIQLAEKHADGLATSDELRALNDHLEQSRRELNGPGNGNHRLVTTCLCCLRLSKAEIAGRWGAFTPPRGKPVLAEFHDIFGNPFRSAILHPEWRTDTAVALARRMYETRDFSGMPILADALQDAGCDNDEILNHCRKPALHNRGCWVVDLVLEKE